MATASVQSNVEELISIEGSFDDITIDDDVDDEEFEITDDNAFIPVEVAANSLVKESWGEWKDVKGDIFWVRSRDYVSTKKKDLADGSIGKTIHVGLYKSSSRQWDVFSRIRPKLVKSESQGSFFYVTNLAVPSKKLDGSNENNQSVLSSVYDLLAKIKEQKKKEAKSAKKAQKEKDKAEKQRLRKGNGKDNGNFETHTEEKSESQQPETGSQSGDSRLWLNLVFVVEITKEDQQKPENAQFMATLKQFVALPDAGKDDRWKMVSSVVEGPLMIRTVIGSLKRGSHKNATPVLLGNKTESNYIVKEDYIECGFDCGCDALARLVIQLAFPICRKLLLDMAFIIQGSSPDSLPERVVGSARFGRFQEDNAEPLAM